MGVARVTIHQLWFGQVVQNVMHFDYGETAYNPDTIKAKMESDWIPQFRPLQLSSLSYFKIQVRNMSAIGGLTSDYVTSFVGSAGSAVEGWGPLCYLFSLKTLTGGHSGRGRIYIAGSYPGNVVQGRFISASMTQQATCAANLTSRFLGATPSTGLNLSVCTRENLPTPLHVTQIIPRDIPAVQRRRNIGVGM